ncbi:oxygenase MpaB family protein [Stenotrophomonas sp. HITSZ_GD]|uniref:oxygenase MpaB family protein n=1 Tax=Stenotrophomonas sp. HITSZ_GD TaxID=3037248 RepID=UPI00240D96F5|nr:oxygenase MpaB family protein [Stenotrophomonas sp. HITSZ_GD]MDG2525176.1 oxygenase MpaB family protein [Stenotrophomonas sp. HITSZ_GD]
MPPLMRTLAAPAAAQVRRWVLDAFPREGSGIEYDVPAGDPGLFGPDSVTWRIHAEFPGMLAGGLCALMLQTLHPRALAAVYDHSNFRGDLVGRLRRTTDFVAGTTYAPEGEARKLIARVRAIHARIGGHTADGQAYRADDPALLSWVHVTEAYGFLEGCRRYGREVPVKLADRYYDEVRRMAEALGAVEVPGSEAEVAAYFARVQPQLRADTRTWEVLGVLARARLPVPAAGLSRDVFLGAGAALLPGWACERLGRTRWQRMRDRASARMMRAMAPLFRVALPDGLAQRACRRMGLSPAVLERWP